MNSQTNQCSTEIKDFLMCRRERDAQIFGAIKMWETQLFSKMAQKDRVEHLKSLEAEKE